MRGTMTKIGELREALALEPITCSHAPDSTCSEATGICTNCEVSAALPLLLDVAEAAGRMLAATPATLECEDFHHPPKDQHGLSGGPCEPLARQRAASEALSAALARLEETP